MIEPDELTAEIYTYDKQLHKSWSLSEGRRRITEDFNDSVFETDNHSMPLQDEPTQKERGMMAEIERMKLQMERERQEKEEMRLRIKREEQEKEAMRLQVERAMKMRLQMERKIENMQLQMEREKGDRRLQVEKEEEEEDQEMIIQDQNEFGKRKR